MADSVDSTMFYAPTLPGFDAVPNGMTIPGQTGATVEGRFQNTLWGSCVDCSCVRACCCTSSMWQDLTRDYNVYQAMTNNERISSQMARVQIVKQQQMTPGQLDRIWEGVSGTGPADTSTDKLKSLINPYRTRTTTGETKEWLEEPCCSCCALARNAKEITSMIDRLDVLRGFRLGTLASLYQAVGWTQNAARNAR
eukprot:968556-Rhodomonas_salina.2